MSKLLRIDRKLRTLSRRLTTDANGAPCCCGGGACYCDPSLPQWRQRYKQCLNGRTDGPYALLPLGRIVRVEVQWSFFSEEYLSAIGTRGLSMPVRDITATQRVWSGRGTICYRFNSRPVVTSGSSAWSYQRVSTSDEPIYDSGNDAGYDAFIWQPYPLIASVRALSPSVAGPSTEWERPEYDWPIDPLGTLQIPTALSQNHDAYRCDYSEDVTITGRPTSAGTPRTHNVYQRRFEDDGTDGKSSGSQNYDDIAFPGAFSFRGTVTTRRVSSWAVGWRRTILTCTTDGDTGQSLQREPGCGNCFDPSKLEPM